MGAFPTPSCSCTSDCANKIPAPGKPDHRPPRDLNFLARLPLPQFRKFGSIICMKLNRYPLRSKEPIPPKREAGRQTPPHSQASNREEEAKAEETEARMNSCISGEAGTGSKPNRIVLTLRATLREHGC